MYIVTCTCVCHYRESGNIMKKDTWAIYIYIHVHVATSITMAHYWGAQPWELGLVGYNCHTCIYMYMTNQQEVKDEQHLCTQGQLPWGTVLYIHKVFSTQCTCVCHVRVIHVSGWSFRFHWTFGGWGGGESVPCHNPWNICAGLTDLPNTYLVYTCSTLYFTCTHKFAATQVIPNIIHVCFECVHV